MPTLDDIMFEMEFPAACWSDKTKRVLTISGFETIAAHLDPIRTFEILHTRFTASVKAVDGKKQGRGWEERLNRLKLLYKMLTPTGRDLFCSALVQLGKRMDKEFGGPDDR